MKSLRYGILIALLLGCVVVMGGNKQVPTKEQDIVNLLQARQLADDEIDSLMAVYGCGPEVDWGNRIIPAGTRWFIVSDDYRVALEFKFKTALVGTPIYDYTKSDKK